MPRKLFTGGEYDGPLLNKKWRGYQEKEKFPEERRTSDPNPDRSGSPECNED